MRELEELKYSHIFAAITPQLSVWKIQCVKFPINKRILKMSILGCSWLRLLEQIEMGLWT